MPLWDMFLDNSDRGTHKWAHYFPIYEQHFSRFVNRPVTLFEIGCGKGGSLQMWKKYLGPLAVIVGLDIKPTTKTFEEHQIAVRIGNQSDTEFLGAVVQEFGSPDIVIDDGSHMMNDVLASFRMLYPLTDRNGVYVVEDTHTSYLEKYGGGLRREGTFIEFCKPLIDQLNGEHAQDELSPTDFASSTLSMHFHDSVVVFEKGRHRRKSALKTGNH